MAKVYHFNINEMTQQQIDKKEKEDLLARQKELSGRDVGFGTCPTVRIVSGERGHPEGFTEINLSDFNPSKHKLWDDGMKPNQSQIEAMAAKAGITLLGANNLPASIDIGGDGEVSLGDVVRAAQAKSGKSVEEWNEQTEADINSLCVAMVFEMTQANIAAKKQAAQSKKTRVKAPATPSGFQ